MTSFNKQFVVDIEGLSIDTIELELEYRHIPKQGGKGLYSNTNCEPISEGVEVEDVEIVGAWSEGEEKLLSHYMYEVVLSYLEGEEIELACWEDFEGRNTPDYDIN